MAKSTKGQAKEVYARFYWALGYLNGGTREENERQAKQCYEIMKRHAEAAAVIASNPNKRLAEDAWLMEALTVSIPSRLASFKERYGL